MERYCNICFLLQCKTFTKCARSINMSSQYQLNIYLSSMHGGKMLTVCLCSCAFSCDGWIGSTGLCDVSSFNSLIFYRLPSVPTVSDLLCRSIGFLFNWTLSVVSIYPNKKYLLKEYNASHNNFWSWQILNKRNAPSGSNILCSQWFWSSLMFTLLMSLKNESCKLFFGYSSPDVTLKYTHNQMETNITAGDRE